MNFYVDINKLKWTIKEVETRSAELVVDGSQCYGTCKYYTQEIFLDETLTNDKKIKTLKHELTHAFINCYLLEQQENYSEEQLCEFVATYSEHINEIANDYLKCKSIKGIRENSKHFVLDGELIEK